MATLEPEEQDAMWAGRPDAFPSSAGHPSLYSFPAATPECLSNQMSMGKGSASVSWPGSAMGSQVVQDEIAQRTTPYPSARAAHSRKKGNNRGATFRVCVLAP